ncbi:MAG: dienelactone hydrolase family protein [Limnohabitans sp.]
MRSFTIERLILKSKSPIDIDPRINATWPAFEAGLKAQGRVFQAFTYPGTQHGFHNNSPPRFQQAAADLSWSRTLALFDRTLKS